MGQVKEQDGGIYGTGLDYATLLAGHYLFNTSEYKNLAEELSRYTNLEDKIKNNIKEVIDSYIFNYRNNSEN